MTGLLRWVGGLVGLVLLAGCTGPLPQPSMAPRPTAAASVDALLRTTELAGRTFSYCASRPVDQLTTSTRRVIVAVHGLDRDACALRAAVVAALDGEPTDTIVLAPLFAAQSDAAPGGHAWHATQWPAGSESSSGLSSYAAMDEFIGKLGDRSITLVGFSGGGQFVNRYAAASPVELHRYVVVNPSSYLYFTPDRAGWDSEALDACPQYNRWRYGLEQLPPYVVASGGADGIMARYPRRAISYLIGTADDNPNASSLDRTCMGRAQGADREERALNYHRHLEVVFGPRMDLRQPIVTVPGVGHDAAAMLDTRWGREALRS